MSFDIISRLILKMKHSEQRPGVLVFLLAEKITRLDSFFSVFSSNLNIVAFLEQNRQAVYSEIAYRLQTGRKSENFGFFEPLLDQAQNYLQRDTPSQEDLSGSSGIKKIGAITRKFNSQRRAVKTVIEVVQMHGTDWIPIEFKRKVAFSVLALPIMFVVYESMRASIIAALLDSGIEDITQFLLGLYAIVSVTGFIQEQRTLQHDDALVFNPYSNLFSLGLSPRLSGIFSRAPRHLFELSAVLSAFVTESKFHTGILAPVLSAVVAAMIWSGTDIVFNFSQQKNQERKKSNSVYNPISNV